MDDKDIIKLFQQRSEKAIQQTEKKYGKYCYYIAYNILFNEQDGEECVNDTYYKAWENIPPNHPNRLSAYLGKITRNLALNKWNYYNADKRGKGQVAIVLEELQESIPVADGVEQMVNEIHFANVCNRFLETLPNKKRIIL